jgi:hypothetical protein
MCPAHFVSLDKPRKKIVVAVRGTEDLMDALSDTMCHYKEIRRAVRFFFLHVSGIKIPKMKNSGVLLFMEFIF